MVTLSYWKVISILAQVKKKKKKNIISKVQWRILRPSRWFAFALHYILYIVYSRPSKVGPDHQRTISDFSVGDHNDVAAPPISQGVYTKYPTYTFSEAFSHNFYHFFYLFIFYKFTRLSMYFFMRKHSYLDANTYAHAHINSVNIQYTCYIIFKYFFFFFFVLFIKSMIITYF